MSARSPVPKFNWRRTVLWLTVVAVAMYVVLPQLAGLKSSFSALHRAHLGLAATALLCCGLTYVFAALSYCLLAFHRLRYRRTLLVQVATIFVNHLVPAGLGGISSNYAYLRTQRHTRPQAITVVAVNNGLGVVANLALLVGAITFGSVPAVFSNRLLDAERYVLIGVLLAAVIGAVCLSVPNIRQSTWRGIRNFMASLLSYRRRPAVLLGSLVCAFCLTAANYGAFWLCGRALGLHFALVTSLLVYSFAVALGAATPTPGGVGGTEAGLVAGLVVIGLPSTTAISVTLLYRLVSYWIPFLAGGASFWLVQKRRLIIWRAV